MKVQSQFIEMFGNPLSDVQKYNIKPLGECSIINPRRANINLEDNDEVSFVPMQSVSEDGNLQDVKAEAFSKVKKGFTYFENNDVLFAKITPCMENGKGAIAQNLTNGIGMGSTEFHVLRPVQGKSNPYWLLALTRMPIFRERASKNMSGTGGQKRVPTTFLENFKIGLPPFEEQEKFESLYKQADKSKFVGFKSQFIEMFDFHELRPNAPSNDFQNECYDDTSSCMKIPASDYLISGKYAVYDQSQDNQIAGYTNEDKGVCVNYPAVLFGDHSRVIKYIDEPFFIGADGVKIIRPMNDNILPKFLYYDLKYHCIPNTGYNRHFKYIKMIELTKASLDGQKLFLSIAEQADKSKYFKQIA